MALREVLKTATSGAHQRDLTQKMEQRLAGKAQGTLTSGASDQPVAAVDDAAMVEV